MNECRYDRESGKYLNADDEVCDTPARDHCQHRRTCPNHLGWGELTCARCLGRVRQDIRQVVLLSALMLPEAVATGVESSAASLAGPSGDPLVLSWRRVNLARQGTGTIGDGSEETDPTEVLGMWQAMLSEDYNDDLPDRITLQTAAAYLERNLSKIANDEEQDFRLMGDEIRRCRRNLESVLRNSRSPERGAPCPTCRGDGTFVRLTREYGHWCDDPECKRFNYATDEADAWVCPRNHEHRWDLESYSRWVEDRKGA